MEILATDFFALFFIASAGSYVATKLVYEEFSDPFGILGTIRQTIQWSFLRGILSCQYCLSFWTSQVVTHLVLQELSLLSVMTGLGAYGVLFILIRVEEIAEQAVYGGEVSINYDDHPEGPPEGTTDPEGPTPFEEDDYIEQ